MALSLSKGFSQAADQLPRWPEAVYSAKTFVAAMLALALAFSNDLEKPYWAMITVYIVSLPLTGLLLSKALYRFAGTLLGAAVTLALIPNLDNAPELLSLALALWIGLCLYFALLDRTPRSYVFLLGGYSTALIGFPAVSDPVSMWDIAVARVEEVSLGIICATAVGTIIFPQSVGPVLNARMDAWLRNVKRLAQGTLRGRSGPELFQLRERLAADAVQLRLLASSLAHDTSRDREMRQAISMLQRRMTMLLPILASIAGYYEELRHFGGPSRAEQGLLQDLEQLLGGKLTESRLHDLKSKVTYLQRAVDAGPEWQELLRVSFLGELQHFLNMLEDCRELRQYIALERTDRLAPSSYDSVADPNGWHRDHGMALLSAATVALTVMATCTIWIGTAWPDGTFAPMTAAVGICFFAAQDDPVPSLATFICATIAAIAIDSIYLFAVFPRIDGFTLLALTLAPVYFLLGIGMARNSLIAMGITFVGITFLALQETYSADFATFLNSGIAALVGLGTAATLTAIFRSAEAEYSIKRLLRAGWADLAELTGHEGRAEQGAFVSRMLDRLGLMSPRLALIHHDASVTAYDALTDVRIGLNVIALRNNPANSESSRLKIAEALAGITAHFGSQESYGAGILPPVSLLRDIDASLQAVLSDPPFGGSPAILTRLTGIRCCLFPNYAFRVLAQVDRKQVIQSPLFDRNNVEAAA